MPVQPHQAELAGAQVPDLAAQAAGLVSKALIRKVQAAERRMRRAAEIQSKAEVGGLQPFLVRPVRASGVAQALEMGEVLTDLAGADVEAEPAGSERRRLLADPALVVLNLVPVQ